jgi:hypothetical protein
MASPSIPTALGHPHPTAVGRFLFHSSGDPTPRSVLPFRQNSFSQIVLFLSVHLVSGKILRQFFEGNIEFNKK